MPIFKNVKSLTVIHGMRKFQGLKRTKVIWPLILQKTAITYLASTSCQTLYSFFLNQTQVSLVAQMVKNLPVMQETGFNPWVRKIPGGEGNGNPLQYSCLRNAMNPPGLNGMGSLSLLQGIFPTQGSSPSLLHCRRILHQLTYQGSLNPVLRTGQLGADQTCTCFSLQ